MKNPQTEPGKFQSAASGEAAVEKKKLPLVLRIFIILVAVIAVLVIAAAITLYCFYKNGQKSMLSYEEASISFKETDVVSEDDGKTIIFNGSTYRLNENMTTVLFMGIDRDELGENELYGTAGQADCILVLCMDTVTGKTTIINLPRDTYAEVDNFYTDGSYKETLNQQLCLAYAYGDGKMTSCQNMVTSVERLLYGIPIQSCIALDFDGLAVANDAIGGVTLPVIGDVTLTNNYTPTPGETITLSGEDAVKYVRTRKWDGLDANLVRMERQQQYIRAFVSSVTAQSKAKPTIIADLYKQVSPYTATDLTLSEATFLGAFFLQHGADFTTHTIESTIIAGEDGRPLYHLDDDDLRQTIIDVFYNPVD